MVDSQERAWRCASAISRAVISQRDLGAAFLAAGAAGQGREVEPFVRFDQVDGDPAASGRIGHAKFEQCIDVAGFGIGKAAPQAGIPRSSD